MKLKRGRPKEPKVKKINPPNIITKTENSGGDITNVIVTYKCDNPKCDSTAEIFLNLKYCKLCAKDKGYAPAD